jgi:Rap1a immunity proteins
VKSTFWVSLLLAVSSFSCLSTPSFAAIGDGTILLKLCENVDKVDSLKDSGELVNIEQCLAYVDGVVAGYSILSKALNLKGMGLESVFVPDEAKQKDMYLVVQKYLKDHPEKLHRAAGELTIATLREAFPCKTQTAQTAPGPTQPLNPSPLISGTGQPGENNGSTDFSGAQALRARTMQNFIARLLMASEAQIVRWGNQADQCYSLCARYIVARSASHCVCRAHILSLVLV